MHVVINAGCTKLNKAYAYNLYVTFLLCKLIIIKGSLGSTLLVSVYIQSCLK